MAGIILLLAIGGSYFTYQGFAGNKNTVQYVTAAVAKGTLISSVSGSGQVSVSDQVDIKPKVSGELVYVGVKNGQEIKAGTLIAQIDSRDASRSLRDAQTALETAQLELEELLEPADAYSLMQAENALIQAKDNLTKLKFSQESDYQDALKAIQEAEDDLENNYEDAFNSVANAFLDLPTLVTGLNNILYSYEIARSEATLTNSWNKSALLNSILDDYTNSRGKMESYINRAESDYKTAKASHDNSLESYKNSSRYSEKELIKSLVQDSLETARLIAEAVKSQVNMLDFWVDYRSAKSSTIFSKVTDYQSDLKTYTSKANSHLSTLLAAEKSIKNSEEAKLNAEQNLVEMEQNNPLDFAASERSVKEKEESLAKLKAEPDELDVRAKKIVIQQKQDALLTAQQNLADHYIRAIFDGMVTNVNVKKGDSVSSGTTLSTLITNQKIAEISLNEIDAAQVKVGQKASLTFDAVADLSITGAVAEIDALGTVSSGVVSYGVKVVFDVQDERVKPGMSVSVNIIIESKANVLLAPISAVKTSGQESYVEVLVNGQLQRKSVVVGSSSDTMIEIVEGLAEGEEIIAQTVSNGISGNASQTQNFRRDSGPSMGGMMMIR